MSAATTCEAADNLSGKSLDNSGIKTAAMMPMTAIVSSSSISVKAANLMQRRCARIAGIGVLRGAAPQQRVLLFEQLFDFPQLTNLVGALLDRIGEWRLAGLWGRAQSAVET